ncbi:hypothetical protein FE783_36885, partial [Paenibacillus mesophilus]|uniref:protein rep n=1 Tax=Paenibacillus mesophilus TaxID=2582849 RepID=UPI00110E31F6
MIEFLKQIEMDFQYLNSVATNIDYNESILDYYAVLQAEMRGLQQDLDPAVKWSRLLLEEKPFDGPLHKLHAEMKAEEKKVYRKLDTMSRCNQKWYLDVYQDARIKDFKKTHLCKDKFCNNCKKVKQASRMQRFIPEIEAFKDHKKIHLVLTLPNCSGPDLPDTIKLIFTKFQKLTEYLSGTKKIKGIDIHNWGYNGAVRSLEVTYKKHSYHPHLHVLLVMDKRFELGKKQHVNSFSKKYGKVQRMFSDKEILIQKIWYLLLNSIKVTKQAIHDLEIGYSSMMDEFKEGDYHELFKYMTKGNGSETGEAEGLMTYDNFKTLYFA